MCISLSLLLSLSVSVDVCVSVCICRSPRREGGDVCCLPHLRKFVFDILYVYFVLCFVQRLVLWTDLRKGVMRGFGVGVCLELGLFILK